MPQLNSKREHLSVLSLKLRQAIDQQLSVSSTTQQMSYSSPIVPYILGDNANAIAKAQQLQDAGFYALPIRPPTVPANTARIRLVMNAAMTIQDCERLTQQL